MRELKCSPLNLRTQCKDKNKNIGNDAFHWQELTWCLCPPVRYKCHHTGPGPPGVPWPWCSLHPLCSVFALAPCLCPRSPQCEFSVPRVASVQQQGQWICEDMYAQNKLYCWWDWTEWPEWNVTEGKKKTTTLTTSSHMNTDKIKKIKNPAHTPPASWGS